MSLPLYKYFLPNCLQLAIAPACTNQAPSNEQRTLSCCKPRLDAMAPAPRAARSQAGKKQAAISTFGRITKSAAVASPSKQLSSKVTPALQASEFSKTASSAVNKRKHDEFEKDQDCKVEEQTQRLVAKKVARQYNQRSKSKPLTNML